MNKDANCHDIFLSNVLGTLNLLEYGKRSRIRKFIFLSSGAVYGYAPYPLSEEHQPRPLDFYGLSKYEAELLVKNYARDFSTVTMRLFYPYGPGQRKGVIHSLTRKILNGEKILLYNNDHPQITPIYITDLVEIIYFSLIKLEGDSLFNVSGEEIASIKDISLLIAKYLGPSPVFEKVTDKRISNQIGVNSKMKQYLDYKLKTRLQEGILSYVRSLSLKRPSSL
jgi:nucleoside-diphosphate-sugar epimerase